MSDVSGPSRSASTPTRTAAHPQARTAPPAEDVRAMGEAFARARMQPQQQAGALGQRAAGGRTALIAARGERTPDAVAAGAWRALDERGALDRREGERHADQGFGGLGQHAAIPVVVSAQFPAPQVDPSGFAQMLADLWTRENGRGAREVRVRFGNATWPATGARLVQSADGMLDITLEIAPGADVPATDSLDRALAEQGLPIGRIGVADAAD